MRPAVKTNIILILTALLLAACSSAPHNPYGDPDSQRERSKQAQDEMSRDTSR